MARGYLGTVLTTDAQYFVCYLFIYLKKGGLAVSNLIFQNFTVDE
jgi:hypothetical protein